MSSPPQESRGPTLVISSSVFFASAVVFFTSRMVVRWKTKYALEDLFLMIGMACATGMYIVIQLSVAHGFGQHWSAVGIAGLSFAAKMTVVFIEFYTWASTFTKLSVVWMLIRIQGHIKWWRRGLYAMAVALVLTGAASTIYNELQCHPISAVWDFSLDRADHCSTWHSQRVKLTVTASIFLVSDVILSLLPITIIANIRLPLREKILLSVLLALGMTCAAASLPKILTFKEYGENADFTWWAATIYIYSFIELCIGLIATSAPPLRTAVTSGLVRVGLVSLTKSRSKVSSNTPGSVPLRDISSSGDVNKGKWDMLEEEKTSTLEV